MKKIMNVVRYMWAFVLQATVLAAWILLVMALMDAMSIAGARAWRAGVRAKNVIVEYWNARRAVPVSVEPTPAS